MVLNLCSAGDVLPNSFVLANCNRYFLRAMLAPEPGVSHVVGCFLERQVVFHALFLCYIDKSQVIEHIVISCMVVLYGLLLPVTLSQFHISH